MVKIILGTLLALLLAACGGGDPEPVSTVTVAQSKEVHPFAEKRAAPLAFPAPVANPYNGVSPEVAVEQLLDFAERQYPALFPGHVTTRWLPNTPLHFRPYPNGWAIGVAAGVAPNDPNFMESGIYVYDPGAGRVVFVGYLLQFVTPTAPTPQAFAATSNPPTFSVLGNMVTAQIVVNANRTIAMWPNGQPMYSYGAAGAPGSFTVAFANAARTSVVLTLWGVRSASYTATFVLQDTSGNQITVNVPFTTP